MQLLPSQLPPVIFPDDEILNLVVHFVITVGPAVLVGYTLIGSVTDCPGSWYDPVCWYVKTLLPSSLT